MKEKLLKSIKFFVSFLLPLSWILGFAAAMTERNAYVKSHFFLHFGIRIVLLLIVVRVVYDMRLREIKGWYGFFCTVATLIVSGLSMWLHLVI